VPQALLAVGGYFLAGAAVITGGVISGFILTIGVAAGLASLARSMVPKVPGQGPESREITVRGTVEHRQLLYGQVKTGGFVAFYGTSGDNNRFLWFCVVAAAHECEEISDVWLDSRHVPDADIESDGEVTTAEFQDQDASRLYVLRHTGGAAQTVDGGLLASFPEWDADHYGYGIANTVFRLDRSENAFPTGAPQSFFQLVKGRKLYDPRLDSTNGGSGTHRTANPSTWAWSRNWALCVRDYISGGAVVYDSSTPDKRLTIGELDARINDTYTTAAANISDENCLIPPASPTTSQDRYTCDCQLSCGSTHRENLEILLSAGFGHLAYVEGKYRIYAGAYDTPTVTLGEADILGPVEVSTHPNGEDLYNLVTGTFFDPDREWTINPFPAQKDAFYAADDGGEKSRGIELHATANNYRAQRIANVHLLQSRNKITANFTALSPRAMDIAEWETFMVTIPEYGWTSKVFRCLEWTFDPSGLPAIVAREDSSDSYEDLIVGGYADPVTLVAPNPNIENPDSPSGFTATGQLNGILFKWMVPSIGRKIGIIELYEYTPGSPVVNVFSNATKIWEGYAFSAFIPQVDTDTRYYWIRQVRAGQRSLTEPAGAGIAGAASSVTSALTVTITPTSALGTGNVFGANPQTVFTNPFSVATASGGTGPYTYAWTIVSGFAMSITAASSDTTKFSAGPFPLDGSTREAIARCTVTDDVSDTAFADIAVRIYWPSSSILG
jgi:hypothetical protein